ncbi:MAG: PBP1A family penicillin-binding protein [Bryobacteraceae bacterium]
MNRFVRYSLVFLAALVLVAFTAIAFPYWKLSKHVDEQLDKGPFAGTYSFYAAPEVIAPGDAMSADDLTAALKRSGYRDATAPGTPGTYRRNQQTVDIYPKGSASYSTPVRIQFSKDTIANIGDASRRVNLESYELGPQLITNQSDEGREKRTMVRFSDLPPVLVKAIVSAEDKRFFQHAGFDPYRIAKAAYVDLKDKRKEQGASTITMQLARNLWLDRDKRWKRKAAELLITMHLERKLSKEKIFEYYCNQVYLGGRGTFSIHGFGEAAHAFFDKDVRKLSVSEAALLAGLIQRPSYFNPARNPERAQERRNLVLRMMHENRYINDEQYESAINSPVNLSLGKTEFSEAQYYLDLASDEAQRRLEGHEAHGAADVNTSLDLRLQRAAENALRDGMQKVDKELQRRHRGRKGPEPQAQAAMIVLDPRTGEIKALCGGRNYSVSQLNRILAKRPPGSVFKPFVYAAALNTAVEYSPKVFTPSSTVLDAPATFKYENQTYSPGNFEHQFHGQVTFRQALAKSMNVAAVRVGQMVGYDAVVALAKRAGMNEALQPTPALALGAYAVTPLEVAGAYTVFANQGVRERPVFVSSIVERDGTGIYRHESETRRVLDPRVSFLMVDMLQEVMRSGTAAGVRSLGFKLPAAGKTGTSHDGWFAGFTSELLCIVWVGFDDYHELGLEGAHSALPIWAQFMNEAARYKTYRDAKPFAPPPGVVRATVDPVTGQLAADYCPWKDTEYFVDGTQPSETCTRHSEVDLPESNAVAEGSPVSVLRSVVSQEPVTVQGVPNGLPKVLPIP